MSAIPPCGQDGLVATNVQPADAAAVPEQEKEFSASGANFSACISLFIRSAQYPYGHMSASVGFMSHNGRRNQIRIRSSWLTSARIVLSDGPAAEHEPREHVGLEAVCPGTRCVGGEVSRRAGEQPVSRCGWES